MTEPEDFELDRRLRDHFRATGAGHVPETLRATVRAGFHSGPGSRGWWTGTGPAAAAVLSIVLGTAVIVGSSRSNSALPEVTSSPAEPGASLGAFSGPPASVPPVPSSEMDTGEVAVLRGQAIRDAALAATDESPFLIGGRTAFVLADCAVPGNVPDTPLLRVCGDGLVIRDGRSSDERPFGGTPLVTDFGPSGPGLGLNEPAVVLRVHTHDARAEECPPAYRVRCEQAVVVEQVVWRPDAGRSETIPAVLSILPSEVEPDECVRLGFPPTRCAAVIELARSVASIPWPAVEAVELEPPVPEVSLGSEGLAVVVFGMVDGSDDRVDVRCHFLRGASLACGPATVQEPSASP